MRSGRMAEKGDIVTETANLRKSAMNSLKYILASEPKDKVLIIYDNECKDIAGAFEESAKELGLNPMTYRISEEQRPLMDVPGDLKERLSEHSIIINTFKSLANETPFRIKLTDLEMTSGARVGHGPGITKEMMTEGPMNVDYRELQNIAFSFMEILHGVEKFHITTEKGTDLEIYLDGREFETDVLIEKGSMGNLPAGEVWAAPVETKASGILVVDGTIGGNIGHVKSELTVEIRDGRVVSMRSMDAELLKDVDRLLSIDEYAKTIGELGIGLNKKARLTGNMLEDEKAARTAHLAFGNNLDMPGGQNPSDMHLDMLFKEPTMEITYLDGSKRVVMVDGELQL